MIGTVVLHHFMMTAARLLTIDVPYLVIDAVLRHLWNVNVIAQVGP